MSHQVAINFANIRKSIKFPAPMQPKFHIHASLSTPTREEILRSGHPLIMWAPIDLSSVGIERTIVEFTEAMLEQGSHLPASKTRYSRLTKNRYRISGVHEPKGLSLQDRENLLYVNKPYFVEDDFFVFPRMVTLNGYDLPMLENIALRLQQIAAALQMHYRAINNHSTLVGDLAKNMGMQALLRATDWMTQMCKGRLLDRFDHDLGSQIEYEVSDAGQPGLYSIIVSVGGDYVGKKIDHIELRIGPMSAGVSIVTSAELAQTLHSIYPYLFIERPRYAKQLYTPKE